MVGFSLRLSLLFFIFFSFYEIISITIQRIIKEKKRCVLNNSLFIDYVNLYINIYILYIIYKYIIKKNYCQFHCMKLWWEKKIDFVELYIILEVSQWRAHSFFFCKKLLFFFVFLHFFCHFCLFDLDNIEFIIMKMYFPENFKQYSKNINKSSLDRIICELIKYTSISSFFAPLWFVL